EDHVMPASRAEQWECVGKNSGERLQIPGKCRPENEFGNILSLIMVNPLEQKKRGVVAQQLMLTERRRKCACGHEDNVLFERDTGGRTDLGPRLRRIHMGISCWVGVSHNCAPLGNSD